MTALRERCATRQGQKWCLWEEPTEEGGEGGGDVLGGEAEDVSDLEEGSLEELRHYGLFDGQGREGRRNWNGQ